MTAPDKKLMQKGWNSEHFERVRNAFARMENFIESEITPYIKMTRKGKCHRKYGGHQYSVVEERTYEFSDSMCVESKCDKCNKKKIEWKKIM
jgi:hypothetical protein